MALKPLPSLGAWLILAIWTAVTLAGCIGLVYAIAWVLL